MNIYEKLTNIQVELKAPKGQFNKFGGYNYRSCEDILEAVKPLCFKYRTTLILNDELVEKGGRVYVRASAVLKDWETDDDCKEVTTAAYAREAVSKKGMDDAQVTGATSSYARKYALNALFNIDDTKDLDTNEYQSQAKKAEDAHNKKVAEKIRSINTVVKELMKKGQTAKDLGDISLEIAGVKNFNSIRDLDTAAKLFNTYKELLNKI